MTTEKNSNTKSNLTEKISITKDLFSTGKEAIQFLQSLGILFVFILLFVNKQPVLNFLHEIGFKKANVGGLEFDLEEKFAKADINLIDNNSIINSLKKQNETLSNALTLLKDKKALLKNKKDNSATLKLATKALETNSQLSEKVQQQQKLNNQSIAANQKILETLVSDSPSEWGVIYGGDSTLDTAIYETTDVAKKYNIPNPIIYKRRGSFRSVSVVNSQEEANKVLSNARKRRSDAYLVNLSLWCPKESPQEKYIECK